MVQSKVRKEHRFVFYNWTRCERDKKMEIEKLAGSLEAMHKEAADGPWKERDHRVRFHNSKTHVHECNFDIGDYVLRSVVHRGSSKLAVR